MSKARSGLQPTYVQDNRKSSWTFFLVVLAFPTLLMVGVIIDYLTNPDFQIYNPMGWFSIGMMSLFVTAMLPTALQKRKIEFYEDHIRVYSRLGNKFRSYSYTDLHAFPPKQVQYRYANTSFKLSLNAPHVPFDEGVRSSAIHDLNERKNDSKKEDDDHFSMLLKNETIQGSQGPFLYDWLLTKPGISTGESASETKKRPPNPRLGRQVQQAMVLSGIILIATGVTYITLERARLEILAFELQGQVFIIGMGVGLTLLFLGLVGLLFTKPIADNELRTS